MVVTVTPTRYDRANSTAALSVVTATQMAPLMGRSSNERGREPSRQLGREARVMNAKKVKALRRAVREMKAAGRVKPSGYSLVEDRGMIFATGERMAYKIMKRLVG